MTDQQQAELVEHVIAGDWQCDCCLEIVAAEESCINGTCLMCWEKWVIAVDHKKVRDAINPWDQYIADVRRAKYGPDTDSYPIFTYLQR